MYGLFSCLSVALVELCPVSHLSQMPCLSNSSVVVQDLLVVPLRASLNASHHPLLIARSAWELHFSIFLQYQESFGQCHLDRSFKFYVPWWFKEYESRIAISLGPSLLFLCFTLREGAYFDTDISHYPGRHSSSFCWVVILHSSTSIHWLVDYGWKMSLVALW